jgi:hypothetical protein
MRGRGNLGRRIGIAIIVALCGVGSCRDLPTAPSKPAQAQDPNKLLGLWGGSSSPQLLVCPSTQTQTTSGIIGIDGGTVSLGGTSVTIPLGALLGQTTVELTIPAGQYMEADLSVNGGQHISFLQPVTVTIDYSRCNPWQTLLRRLSVWNIDQDTKALLENEGGLDNKLLRQITFTTSHFSGFAIAY